MRESYSFGRHVTRYIRKHRPEIDFVYIIAWPLLAQYQIVKTAKKYSIPSVVHIEDIYPESLSNKIPVIGKLVQKLLLPMDAYILNNSSKVVAVSENMRNTFIRTRGVPAEKIALIQNWQDESGFINYHHLKQDMAKQNAEKQPFTFMYLGNIGAVAGVDFIIKCFAIAGIQKARLIIAGSGSMKKSCFELASSFKSAHIEFWDVPTGHVAEIQDKADVMLLPVKNGAAMSSIPSKLSAYMFSQKPVISCVEETSDTANAIKRANCGWVVPPENTDQLMRLFRTVITIPESELLFYGKNGFQYALENFSKENNLPKLVNLIHETASNGNEIKSQM
jgi:glycosyltransferase involved in cell wall biosynthesis